VVLVFMGNMAFATWVIVTANSDPSFAVEQDYYAKALHWNKEIDQRKINEELGWTVSLAEAPRVTSDKHADIVLTVLDAGGHTLSDATITAVAFPVARAATKASITFDGVAPGRYAARIYDPRHGKWELRVAVTHGEDRFTTRIDAVVTPE